MAETLRQSLNRTDPNTLADMLRSLGIGDVLRKARTALRALVPAASNASQLATLATVSLPEDAKASLLTRAYARTTSAAGTLGELTIVAYGVTPADGQAAVAPNGDLVTLAASAYTSVDFVYEPEEGDVVASVTLPVVSNAATIPTAYAGGTVLLMLANAVAGTSTGVKKILIPGTAPAAGQARLNVAKSQILFASADAVTSCTVDILVAKGLGGGIDPNAALEGSSSDV